MWVACVLGRLTLSLVSNNDTVTQPCRIETGTSTAGDTGEVLRASWGCKLCSRENLCAGRLRMAG